MSNYERLKEEHTFIAKLSKSPPIDIKGIIQRAGIQLVERYLGNGISGQICKITIKDFEIAVAEHEPLCRKRFTMAHEFAHYFLHRDYIKIGEIGLRDTISYTTSVLTMAQEIEANKLAADILMPLPLVLSAIDTMKEKATIETLSRKFEVSEIAMRIRLGIAG